jgi:serine protease
MHILPLVILATGLAFLPPVQAAPTTGDVLVKLRDDVPADTWQRRERLDATVTAISAERRLPLRLRDAIGGRWLRLQPTAGLSAEEFEALRDRLRKDPRVADVVAERRERALAVTPNDSRFAEQWWLQARTTGNTGVGDFANAWMRRTGTGTGPVAVLDSGITFHPDLAAQVLPGHDFVSDADYAADGDGRDADPSDEGDAITAAERQALPAKFGGCPPQTVSGWHGTVIAGQIAAVTNNANGVAGAGHGTTVLPVRVAAKCGAAQGDIVAGMRWAAGLAVDGVPANPTPARVIVVSYGSEAACDAVYTDAIAEVRAAGALVIAAAGNERKGVFRPASCAGAFAVTALNREGFKATYANYGPQVQLATPGGDDATGGSCDNELGDGGLVSTGNLGDSTPGLAGYVAASGTSFAAPSVAATAALMLGVNPTLTVDQLVQGLRDSAAPFVQVPLLGNCAADDNPGRCTCTGSACGAGQLDADQALAWAASPSTWSAPVRPTVTLRDARIETCALVLGRLVPPVPDPDPPTPEPETGSGGGAASPLWLLLLAAAAWALRRPRVDQN